VQITTVVGTLIGIFAIFGGALLEGLHLTALLQPTAALIVLGGTLAAVMVSFPRDDLRTALRAVPNVFNATAVDLGPVIDEIVTVATHARKEGLLAMEPVRQGLQDPLLKKSLKYVIDGYDPQTVGAILDAEIEAYLEQDEVAAKVWEAAGGYSPTIGIIGAVLGLIHVMQALDNPSQIGGGIAVAFVATVYGVASANLVFLPWGAHLKRKAMLRTKMIEIIKRGVMAIQEGANPTYLKEQLEALAKGSSEKSSTEKSSAESGA
jgi:chemotaxis protein MotA